MLRINDVSSYFMKKILLAILVSSAQLSHANIVAVATLDKTTGKGMLAVNVDNGKITANCAAIGAKGSVTFKPTGTKKFKGMKLYSNSYKMKPHATAFEFKEFLYAQVFMQDDLNKNTKGSIATTEKCAKIIESAISSGDTGSITINYQ